LAPERAIGLHFGRGQSLFQTGDWDNSSDSFQQMLRAATEAGNSGSEGVALYQNAYTYYWAHRFEDALDFAERARRLALKTDDQNTLAGSLITIAGVRQVTGDLQNARTV